MKIDLLTFHFVSNQGGVLQCLAMQRFLEKQGHEVHVVDYRPPYHTVRYSAVKNPFLYARWYWRRFHRKNKLRRLYIAVLCFFKCVSMNLKGTDRGNAAIFADFVQKHLHLTEKYTSLKQLRKAPPQADAFITGSDQLWNPDLLDFTFDPAYFLDFGSEAFPRIAYAVSTGKVLSDAERGQLKKLCGKLSAVSLREYDRETVEAIGRDVHICIDPTLLLEKADYAPYEAQPVITGDYIFVYGFENKGGLHEAVEAAVRKYGCRVVNGTPNRIFLDEKAEKLDEYGPDQFLTLIRNAACVVTNSFHGTAFSVIYQKDFITVAHSTRGGRMTELLTKLGLRERLWGASEFSLEGPPDYEAAYQKLKKLKDGSEEYLREALKGKRGEEIPHHPDETAVTEVQEEKEPIRAYYGFYPQKEKCAPSASGGAATALAELVLADGGVVYGVEYSPGFKTARYARSETTEELERLRGSKYIYPELRDEQGRQIFDAVEEELRKDRKVLFFGLGCVVSGLYHRLNARQVRTEGLLTVDLICHGPTYTIIQKEFVESLERRLGASLVSFNSRYSRGDWNTPYLRAEAENGRVYLKPLYDTDFGFALKYYCRNACYHCAFKEMGHKADITVGDFWGILPGMEGYNRDGVSLLLSRTLAGDQLIERLRQTEFRIGEADTSFAKANNPMYGKSADKPTYYAQFGEDLEKHGLHSAVKRSPGYQRFLKVALRRRLTALRKR